jgi:RNA polymerase sigma-70 factor, ECF subfamily
MPRDPQETKVPVSPSLPESSAAERAEDEMQLSDSGRVHKTVGSMAISNGPLAIGGRSTEDAPALRPGENLSDAEVMLKVKAGDDGAFGYLVQKYRRPMISFMYRMAHNSAAAEDLAQEVFLRVYRSRSSYEASAKFTTWLYRIATNLAMNFTRDTRHERPENQVSLDEPAEEDSAPLDVADRRLTAEQDLLRRERLQQIRKRVQSLPERQRLAVVMHKYQQMDYKQIAEVLKLSESATKSLLFRAYETLREQLKEFV